ncbi:ABC transporter permease [Leekyejoonella antrihumi]|uniref:ABC transporter permease n=1 Tax=Leekyejoonella antrihumi TaxID=1660198 RepID=UPI001C97B7E9|nr:ABC transporter permease subunit [Leekyejoonella antrihumi]
MSGLSVRKIRSRWVWLILAAAWLALYLAFHGTSTLPLSASSTTSVQNNLNSFNNNISNGRNSNPVFLYGVNYVQVGMTHFVSFLQSLISQPGFGRPAPLIGWLGVIAIVGFVSWLTAGWKYAVLGVVGFYILGLQGLWQESMDTLALTIAAVLIAVVIGVPLGIWIGLHDRAQHIVLPVLGFLQTMPSFVYLAPLTLLFLIGNASATIATLIFAIPPVIRLTDHGIRAVAEPTIEASDSLGSTTWQKLVKVLLPMSRRTIVLGINQTMMAALSMVTIAALISAPGLGQVVIDALQTLDVGTAFNGGLAIVVMAIVLDRTTSAVGERSQQVGGRHLLGPQARRLAFGAGAVVTLWAVVESAMYVWANTFPSSPTIGPAIVAGASNASNWVQSTFSGITVGLRNDVTIAFLNPLQSMLTNAPFWLVILGLCAIAMIIGNARVAIVTLISLLLIVGTGVWQDAMQTLAMTIVATVLTLIIGIAVGVWMGRNRQVDRFIRPILDAFQVMPAFVYLVPFLALFGASRFTAIIAAMAFAIPVVVKVVADGIHGVPAPAIEAATAAGSSTWQLITRVQLPLATRSLALAANQGLIYVLSMVVVGGMVGAGALGYDVYSGFVQAPLFGKGLAAGLAIVLLGVVLDHISQSAANRIDPSRH